MKTEPKLPAQQQAKSIADYTPFELWETDQFQNRNRGFRDEEDEELENVYEGEDGE